MAVNGQIKGKTFERDIVHILTEKFGPGFSRIPQSGAAFGGSNFKRALGFSNNAIQCLTGDLITPDGYPFSIECKSHKDLAFNLLLSGSCQKMDEWISQSSQDAKLNNKEPIVVFKLNNKGIFVCLRSELINKIHIENYIKYKIYTIITLEVFLQISKELEILKDFLSKIINTHKQDDNHEQNVHVRNAEENGLSRGGTGDK